VQEAVRGYAVTNLVRGLIVTFSLLSPSRPGPVCIGLSLSRAAELVLGRDVARCPHCMTRPARVTRPLLRQA
jgi:hypothetical protein